MFTIKFHPSAYFALLGKIDSPFCLQNCLFLLAAYFAQKSASKLCQGLQPSARSRIARVQWEGLVTLFHRTWWDELGLDYSRGSAYTKSGSQTPRPLALDVKTSNKSSSVRQGIDYDNTLQPYVTWLQARHTACPCSARMWSMDKLPARASLMTKTVFSASKTCKATETSSLWALWHFLNLVIASSQPYRQCLVKTRGHSNDQLTASRYPVCLQSLSSPKEQV